MLQGSIELLTLLMFAIISGPVGLLTIWLRIAFIIDILAHSSILGFAIADFFSIPISYCIFGVTIAISAIIISIKQIEKKNEILAIISQTSVALGMVLLFFNGGSMIDHHYFCGNIHSISISDFFITLVLLFSMMCIWLKYRMALFSILISEELAFIDGYNTKIIRAVTILIIVIIVAQGVKIAGVLSVSAILLIPSMIFRGLSPAKGVLCSSLLSIIGVIIAFFASSMMLMPIGPLIIIFILFATGILRIGIALINKYK